MRQTQPTVAKKKKTEETNAVSEEQPVTSAVAPEETAPAAAKPATKKSAAKKTSSKAAAKKAPAKKSAKKAPAKSAAEAKQVVEPTDEQISIRAYFIAERRAKMSLHGDPSNDWIQAREELIAELKNRNSSANGNGSH